MRRSLPSLIALLSCVFPGLFLTSGCSDPSPWTEVEIGTSASFRDVFFIDARRGWIVGGGFSIEGGLVGETRDGGLTWAFRSNVVTHPTSRLFHLKAVHFFDERIGIIASDGGQILRTVDGGAHWHPVFKEGRRSFNALHFINESEGWAAGDGLVAHTADAGATWQRVNERGGGNDDFHARGVHFVSRQSGLLVGDLGRVARSDDAGRTWSPVDVPLGPDAPRLWALHFADDRLAWIVGDQGTILHSQDAGATWTPQVSGTRFDLRDAHFIDASRGFAVGSDSATGTSLILHTSDGGLSWAVQQTVTGESLFALGFLDGDGPNLGWAVGERVRREPQKLLRYEPAPETGTSR